MVTSFLLGLLTGATAAWVLKDSIVARIDTGTRSARARAANRLREAADAIEGTVAATPAAEAPPRIARAS